VLHLETVSNKDPIAVNASSDEKDEIRYVADLSGSCIQGMQVHGTHCCVRGAVQYGQVCCFLLLCNKHVSFTLTLHLSAP
jgi:hypothetical protein